MKESFYSKEKHGFKNFKVKETRPDGTTPIDKKNQSFDSFMTPMNTRARAKGNWKIRI